MITSPNTDAISFPTLTRNMYLFLSSADSATLHPKNSTWDFTVDFQKTLILKGEWECALMSVHYKGKKKDLLCVYSDLCSNNNIIHGQHLPVMRRISGPGDFVNPYYIPVSRECVNQLRVYIRTEDGELPSFQPELLTCTLLLRQRRDH